MDTARRRLSGLVAAAALAICSLPASASVPRGTSFTATAGAVAVVRLSAFVPMGQGQNPIQILGATSGDVAGAALIGRTDRGVAVSPLNVGCRFSGPCTEFPVHTVYATGSKDEIAGLEAGTYELVVLGRAGARVSLRLDGGLRDLRPRFTAVSPVQSIEMRQQYPSLPDEMPAAYFDEVVPGTAGRNVTLLVAHLDASRPKSVQYSSCVRTGPLPAVHVPRYGSACMGDDGAGGLGGASGVVSAGGSDCTTLPPACIPLTTEALHVGVAYAQVLFAPGHVSVTADITALYSDARASVLTFRLP